MELPVVRVESRKVLPHRHIRTPFLERTDVWNL
jgi:hypothetical protein